MNDNDILNEVRRLERQETDPKRQAAPNHELRKALSGAGMSQYICADCGAKLAHRAVGEAVEFIPCRCRAEKAEAEVERLTKRAETAERQLAEAREALESPALLEQLAEVEHERWMRNAKTLAAKEKLSPERLERWERECFMPYAQLSEQMKEYDRIEARNSLAVIRAALGEKGGEW